MRGFAELAVQADFAEAYEAMLSYPAPEAGAACLRLAHRLNAEPEWVIENLCLPRGGLTLHALIANDWDWRAIHYATGRTAEHWLARLGAARTLDKVVSRAHDSGEGKTPP